MLASKPQCRREAKRFCGRKVRKGFVPEVGGKSKLKYFSGNIVECPIFDGEVCYRIEYDDGDIEDIAWEELVKIILPEGDMDPQPSSTPGGGLTDTTNRLASAKGTEAGGAPAAKGLRQEAMLGFGGRAESPANLRQTKQTKQSGFATPPTEEELEQSGMGTIGQQPRVQRQGRTHKRDASDDGAPLGDSEDSNVADAGALALGTRPKRNLRQQSILQEEAVSEGIEEEDQEERPPKRRAGSPTNAEVAQADEAPLAGGLHEPEDTTAGGFVARAVGSAGHIAKIHLENFMCHHHFELEMGTHVNLISGTNGSGKSAVMQALQICLGVSARSTGRGTNLASLIRSGANDAKVQVTLWNTGDDAFMPETFGNRITVERNLKAAGGAATYALLDARGRKVGFERGEKAKDVLDRMLDHFSLDASNPLTIITQDMSRQFLSGKEEAKAKYDMFMSGTLLEDTQESLKGANAFMSKIMKNFEDTATLYKTEKQTEAQLTSKLQKLKSADKKLQDREMLERAMTWRAVHQMEERLEAAKAAAQTRGPELVELYDRHLEAIAQAKEGLQNRLVELDEELRRHKEIVDNHTEHIRALLKAEKDSRLAMERSKRSKSTAQDLLHQLHNDKQVLDDRLAQETSGMAAEARRIVEEHQQQVTAKQAALNEAHEAVNAAHRDLEAARSEMDNVTQQEQAARRSVNRAESLVAEFRAKQQQLAAGNGDRLAMFHAVELNRLIDQNIARFHHMPIGPIGALLKVTEQRWLLAAEMALGSVFRDYLVACSEDAVTLRRLMHQAGYKRAAVVTTCFTAPPHNIPESRRPANGFTPLLDVLLVDDAAARFSVINYIVDKHRIEGIALVENNQAGRSIIYACTAGPHVTVAIDVDGNWYRRNGNLKWTERNQKVRPDQCHLMADMSQYVASLQRDMEQCEAELGSHREDLERLSAQLQQARTREAQCDHVVKTARQQKVRATTELNRALAAAPDMPRMEDDEEASIVLTQLASIQNDLADSQMNLQNAEEELAIAEQAHKQAVQQAAEEKTRFEEQMEDGLRLRHVKAEVADKLKNFEEVRINMVSTREQVKDRLAKLRRGVEVAEAQAQQAHIAAAEVCSRAEGEEALADALQYVTDIVAKQLNDRRKRDRQFANMEEEGLRNVQKASVDAWMDFSGLEKQLNTVSRDIAKVEMEAGFSDVHELEIRLTAQSKLVATQHQEYRRAGEMLGLLQASYDKQTRLFEDLRKGMENLTQNKFAKYMRRRDHEGKLMWNHVERTLKMLIKPKGKNNKDAQTVEDLKQLSGGERSFTTVAFLLAIGVNTESPFRCMDEFDVFMDPVNRRVATETLLEFALENPAFQYIFLTPQDIQAVEDARQEVMRKQKQQLPPAFLKTVQIRPARAG